LKKKINKIRFDFVTHERYNTFNLNKRGGIVKKSSFNFKIVVVYSCHYGDKGFILSRHKTYEAAEKSYKKYSGGFVAIKTID